MIKALMHSLIEALERGKKLRVNLEGNLGNSGKLIAKVNMQRRIKEWCYHVEFLRLNVCEGMFRSRRKVFLD